MATEEYKSNLKKLQEKTKLALMRKQQLLLKEEVEVIGWEEHVNLLHDFMQIAAEEGEWDFSYDFKKDSADELVLKVGHEFKNKYGDIMVVINVGWKRIDVSWRASHEA